MEQTQAYSGMLDLLASMAAAMTSGKTPQAPAKEKEGEESGFRKLLDQAAQANQTEGQSAVKDEQAAQSGQPAESGQPGEDQAPGTIDPMTQQRQMELAAALTIQSPAAQTIQPVVEEQPQQILTQPEAAEQLAHETAQVLPVQEQTQTAAEEATPLETALPTGQTEEKPQAVQAEAAPRQEKPEQAQPEEISQVREKPAAKAERTQAPQEDGQEEELLVTERPESQPVFRQQNATYVKVGEAAPAEQTQEEQPAEKQVAVQLEKALEAGESKVQIHLTPENLGSVQVEITRRADGAIHVVLSAEKVQTQSLLEKHAAGLQSMVAQRSQEPVTVQVERREDSQGDYEGHNGQSQQNGREDQRQNRRQESHSQDFLQQLRLGLTPAEAL